MEMQLKDSLRWPDGWERTPIGSRRAQGGWKKSLKQYRESLESELKRTGATDALLTYNEVNERLDPGVAVYFSRQSKEDFSWQVVLGLNTPAPTLDEIDSAYKKKAMIHHPDRGGDIEVFRSLTKYREQARAWVLGTHTAEHEYVIACDKFSEVRLNVAAIRMALAALRQLDRIGVSSILERTFRGFKTALPKHEEMRREPVTA
jgi:hypothetical protein